MQRADLRIGEGIGRGLWEDARLVQHLIGHPVADATDGAPLVEEYRLHLTPRPAQHLPELLYRRRPEHGIRRELVERRLG